MTLMACRGPTTYAVWRGSLSTAAVVTESLRAEHGRARAHPVEARENAGSIAAFPTGTFRVRLLGRRGIVPWPWGGTMSELLPNYLDVTKLALGGFLARYREPTLTAYRTDLRCYWRWCAETDVNPLRVTRAQLELYVRTLESR